MEDILINIYNLLDERLPKPEGVNTVEPPAGEQVTDKFGKVRQFRDGKWCVWSGGSWAEMKGNLEDFRHAWGPFRPTTDADRKREGLSVRRVNVTIADVYAAPDEHGFLRINVGPETAVIDQNASNVTVTDVVDTPADDLPGEPVEPGDLRAGDRVAFTWMQSDERITCTLVSTHSPVGYLLRSDIPGPRGYLPPVVSSGEWCHGIFDVRLIERAPREDEDPDEPLAKVLWGLDDPETIYGWDRARVNGVYHRMARAAREHIKAEGGNGGAWKAAAVAAHRGRERAEAEIERLTRERDEAKDALSILVKRQTDDQSKIERLTRERDEAEARYAITDRRWRDRYRALREDAVTDFDQLTHDEQIARYREDYERRDIGKGTSVRFMDDLGKMFVTEDCGGDLNIVIYGPDGGMGFASLNPHEVLRLHEVLTERVEQAKGEQS